MCFCDFNEIAEYAIGVDFQGFDAAALLLFRLKLGDPVPPFGGGGTELVKFGIASFPDHSAIGRGSRGGINQSIEDPSGKLVQFTKPRIDVADQRQIENRQNVFDSWD